MTIYHRKLFRDEQPYTNQPSNSSDCNPAVPYNCDYTSFYWPPETPQLPPSTTTNNNYHVSPYLIIVVTLIASVVLFISYYLIIIRYCARLRQVNEQSRNFINEDHQPEVDHPIWYINTIGLQPSVINSITVFTFRKDDSLIESKGCSVCLSEFENNENLRLLPKCNHAFHIICIDTWLRSHTNCPLCRAAVVSNESNVSLQANDQRRNLGVGLNQNIQMGNQESDSELDLNHVHESQVQESKTEVVETVVKLRRSFSMDSAANTIVMDLNLSNSTNELQSLNNMRNSRTRKMMMMMVRSFSYGGRSIL